MTHNTTDRSFVDRCNIAAACLPKSDYRTKLAMLHTEMLADRDMLRDALAAMVAATETGPVDGGLWHALEDARQALAQTIGPSEARCACKERALSACPGEWEPGCDLGSNPAHAETA